MYVNNSNQFVSVSFFYIFAACVGTDKISDTVSSSVLLQARRTTTLQVSSSQPVNFSFVVNSGLSACL